MTTIEQALRGLFTTILAKKQPTEADTEKHLIWPTLEAHRLAAKGRSDVPHALLFLDDAAELLRLERRLSDMVNAAYGLTPEEVRLMWEMAPPRMPLDPAQELERLKHSGSN